MSTQVIKEESFVDSNGCKFYTRTWKPENGSIATVTFIHGLGEHCSRYDDAFTKLAQNGLTVNAFDLRGHGKTSGGRGHSEFAQTFKDINFFAQKADASLPHFVMGQSMGGCITLGYSFKQQTAKEVPIHGVVAMSPFLKLTHPRPVTTFFGKLISNVLPDLALNSDLKREFLSRDKEEVKKYNSDKLVHDRISLITGRGMFDTGEKLLQMAKDFTLPLLIVHGTADQICDPKAAQEFVTKAASTDKTAKIVPDAFHELLFELEKERDEVINTVAEWLVQRAKSTKIEITDSKKPTEGNNENVTTSSNQEPVKQESVTVKEETKKVAQEEPKPEEIKQHHEETKKAVQEEATHKEATHVEQKHEEPKKVVQEEPKQVEESQQHHEIPAQVVEQPKQQIVEESKPVSQEEVKHEEPKKVEQEPSSHEEKHNEEPKTIQEEEEVVAVENEPQSDATPIETETIQSETQATEQQTEQPESENAEESETVEESQPTSQQQKPGQGGKKKRKVQ